MPRKVGGAAMIALALLAGCATTRSPANGVAVVERYLDALNRRDLLALAAYVTPDFEWYSIANGERTREVAGREALAAALRQFFDRYAEARWRIEAVQAVSAHIAVRERSEWREVGGVQSRVSLGVYELSDGRIRRVTYFLNGE